MFLLPVQWHALALGLFASIIAPFGGFFASGFKRAFKIKVCSASLFCVSGNSTVGDYTVITSINILKFYRILATVYLDMVALLTEWIVK